MNIKEIKAREQDATPGPWKHVETDDYSEIYDSKSWGKSLRPLALVGSNIADADFIAHAREDIPVLLAEVERLQSENDTLKKALEMSVKSAQEAMIKLQDAGILTIKQMGTVQDNCEYWIHQAQE
jgi:hypothetical protein